MWQKDSSEKWKVIFDLGGAIAEQELPGLSFPSQALSLEKKSIENAKTELSKVVEFDKAYVEVLRPFGSSFNPAYFSSEGRMHRRGSIPLIGKQMSSYKEPNMSFEMKSLNGRIASSGDLAYTYGLVAITIDNNGAKRKANASYFRIWKKMANEWKIVLDVVG